MKIKLTQCEIGIAIHFIATRQIDFCRAEVLKSTVSNYSIGKRERESEENLSEFNIKIASLCACYFNCIQCFCFYSHTQMPVYVRMCGMLASIKRTNKNKNTAFNWDEFLYSNPITLRRIELGILNNWNRFGEQRSQFLLTNPVKSYKNKLSYLLAGSGLCVCVCKVNPSRKKVNRIGGRYDSLKLLDFPNERSSE